MAKIPLNYFVRISVPQLSGTPTPVYQAPFQRAGIVISALATNPTNVPMSITAGLCTQPIVGTTNKYPNSTLINFIENFQIPPNDTVNIIVNKIVLGEYDTLFLSNPAGTTSNTHVTLSILETNNTPF
jgi:hypothetical protein